MGIESSFNYISDLDASNPDGTDNANMGDDHIRGIKNVLVTTFPNISGVVTATHTELSFVSGVTSAIQTQFSALDTRITGLEGALSAPSGLKMLIRSSTIPTGWEQDKTYSDCMLRVIDGATPNQLTTGDSPILMNKVPSHTHTVTGTTSTDGNHYHTMPLYNGAWGAPISYIGTGITAQNPVGSTNYAGDHSHSVNGTAAANSGADNWTPNYIDLLLITKI